MKTIKRTQAADILDHIRVMLAEGSTPEKIAWWLYHRYGIEPLQECIGGAHQNPLIDNCTLCAPRFGVCGDKIKIT